MVEIKELTKNLPDRIGRVYSEGYVTVVEIPNGRLLANFLRPCFVNIASTVTVELSR